MLFEGMEEFGMNKSKPAPGNTCEVNESLTQWWEKSTRRICFHLELNSHEQYGIMTSESEVHITIWV